MDTTGTSMTEHESRVGRQSIGLGCAIGVAVEDEYECARESPIFAQFKAQITFVHFHVVFPVVKSGWLVNRCLSRTPQGRLVHECHSGVLEGLG